MLKLLRNDEGRKGKHRRKAKVGKEMKEGKKSMGKEEGERGKGYDGVVC